MRQHSRPLQSGMHLRHSIDRPPVYRPGKPRNLASDLSLPVLGGPQTRVWKEGWCICASHYRADKTGHALPRLPGWHPGREPAAAHQYAAWTRMRCVPLVRSLPSPISREVGIIGKTGMHWWSVATPERSLSRRSRVHARSNAAWKYLVRSGTCHPEVQPQEGLRRS